MSSWEWLPTWHRSVWRFTRHSIPSSSCILLGIIERFWWVSQYNNKMFSSNALFQKNWDWPEVCHRRHETHQSRNTRRTLFESNYILFLFSINSFYIFLSILSIRKYQCKKLPSLISCGRSLKKLCLGNLEMYTHQTKFENVFRILTISAPHL